MIPLFKVHLNDKILENLAPVFESGYIGEGTKVKEFAHVLERWLCRKVILVNSCTSALHLAYHMTNVSQGEVISTPMTCMATNTPLLNLGAKIVWSDIDPSTGNIDVDDVFGKLTGNTKAIVCTHYGGNLCDERILDIAQQHKIPLIEDCAHLINIGYGDYQCFSFQAIKFLTTGDGGALVTNSDAVYDRAKLLRWYGIDRETGSDMRCMNLVHEAGYKFHMNDINATIGLSNLTDLAHNHNVTKLNAKHYNEAFQDLQHVKTIKTQHRNDYWLYILLVDNQQQFIEHMKQAGIATSLVHARNDTQPIFSQSRSNLPGLDTFFSKQVCIPVGHWVTEENREHIINTVKEYDKICID